VRSAIVPLLCLTFLAACAAPPPAAPEIGEHAFGESFTTPHGRMEWVGKTVLGSLVQVMDDSRCPRQVTCVWQGAAKVRIGVMIHESGIDHQDLELATFPEASRIASIGGYRVELIDLAPYPEVPGPADSAKYSVTLRVTRGE
jgi:hypothetical protein